MGQTNGPYSTEDDGLLNAGSPKSGFARSCEIPLICGIRACVPGLVAFGVVVANVTFSRYDEELAAAAEERLSSLLP